MKEIRGKAAEVPRFLTVTGDAEFALLRPKTMSEMLTYGRTPHRRMGRVSTIVEFDEIRDWAQRLRKVWSKEN